MNRGLLDRFYRGECSQEEVQAVLKWLQHRALNPKQEQEFQALWQEAGEREEVKGAAHDMERIFSRIKAQIEMPQQEKTNTAARILPWRQRPFWLKAAAAVLLPLCLIWALVQHASRASLTPAIYVSVAAAPGIKKTINLPDGSVITLNSGSKVSFRKGLAGDKREIVLRGEAFFEVAKDSLRPFIVHTGSVSTQALGTSFNINYNLYDTATTVALATGVVKINKQETGQLRQIARLAPGQQLSYNGVSKHHAVAPFDMDEALGWRQGVLNFRQANMDQTIRKLENWYGVDIEVNTHGMSDKAWNYTGEYKNAPLDRVLEGIGFVKGFTYERTGNRVKIVFNQASGQN